MADLRKSAGFLGVAGTDMAYFGGQQAIQFGYYPYIGGSQSWKGKVGAKS